MKNSKSKFLIRKNIILLTVLLLVLVLCTYTNIKFKNSDKAMILGEAQFVNNTLTDEEDYFTQTRMEIELARDTEISHLKSLLESENIDTATKDEARRRYFEITQSIEQEKICEGLIKNKINYDLMVNVNPPQVNVTIKAGSMNDLEIARIKEIIISQTNLTSESIKISLID